MGFDGFLFARIDYGDKEQRLKDKAMELVWKSRPDSRGLFTAALYGPLYGAPKGFCYESWICDDPQIVDNPTLKSYNLPERVSAFVRTAKEQVHILKQALFLCNIVVVFLATYAIWNFAFYPQFDKCHIR